MPRLDEYEKLIKQHDFRELDVWEENADRFFKSQDEMIAWIDQPSIVPFLKFVPTAKQESFRNEVIKKMVQETLRPDGTCFETFRRINVFARK